MYVVEGACHSPVTAALPFSASRQPKSSFFGCIRAKVLAASNPMPELAPVTNMVLFVRSVLNEGER